jgi:hypothetical protein
MQVGRDSFDLGSLASPISLPFHERISAFALEEAMQPFLDSPAKLLLGTQLGGNMPIRYSLSTLTYMNCVSEPSRFDASAMIGLLAIGILQRGHVIWFSIFFPFRLIQKRSTVIP